MCWKVIKNIQKLLNPMIYVIIFIFSELQKDLYQEIKKITTYFDDIEF